MIFSGKNKCSCGRTASITVIDMFSNKVYCACGSAMQIEIERTERIREVIPKWHRNEKVRIKYI